MAVIYVSKQTLKNLPERKAHDFYETPLEVAEEALSLIRWHNYSPKIRVLDIGHGNGIWGQAWRNIVGMDAELWGVDIREVPVTPYYDYELRADFLDDTIFPHTEMFSACIGNPPYKYANQMLEKSLRLTRYRGYVMFLLKSSFLESITRWENFYGKGLNPKIVWTSVRRIDFTGKKNQSDMHSLFLWEKGWQGETTQRWFNYG